MTHDYWIGDHVWVANLNSEGIFEGEENDMALIRVKGKTELIPFTQVTRLDETEDETGVDLDEFTAHQTGEFSGVSLKDIIDLHIEVLNPKLVHAEPVQILAHQRNRLRSYLDAVIDKKMGRVTIIHGKGDGVLRSEVLHILSGIPEVRNTEHEEHGGAVVVRFQYH